MFKDENRHYSLRKLSVGLASVLIGISFASGNSHTVKADTVKDGSNGAQTVIQTTARGSNTVIKGHDVAVKIDAKDGANTAAKANAESTPKEQSQTSEVVKKNSDAITQDIRQKAVKASEAIAKRQNNTVKDYSDKTTLNAKDRKAIAESTPEEQSQTSEVVKKNSDTITQDIKQKAVNTKAKQQNITVQGSDTVGDKALKSNNSSVVQEDSSAKNNSLTDKNNALKAKAEATKKAVAAVFRADSSKTALNLKGTKIIDPETLKENKIETIVKADPARGIDPVKFAANGGFDPKIWGMMDTSKWRLDASGNITGYTGDMSHIIIPNASDFAKAGKNYSQIGISSGEMQNLVDYHNFEANTLAISLTDNKKVKATNADWSKALYESSLKQANLEGLDTSNVTNMSSMFSYASDLTSLDVSNWDTSKVTDMSHMFDGASDLTSLDVSNWDTSKVTDMDNMFFYAYGLTNLDVSNWDTSNVTDMSNMFSFAQGLTSLDVSKWDTSKVTNMGLMFSSDPKLALIVNGDKFADYLVKNNFMGGGIDLDVKSVTTDNTKLLQLLTNDSQHDSATRTIVFAFPANYSPDLAKYHLTKIGSTYQIKQSADYDKPYLQGTVLINATADITKHHIDTTKLYKLSDTWQPNYDKLVLAHKNADGTVSFDKVQLPKVPGYTAKVTRNNGLLMVSYLVFAPEKPATNNNLNELQFSNKLVTDSAVQFNSTVKSNIVVKSDMYQIANDDHNWQLPVIKSYDLKFATNKNQIIFAYTKDKQYNYRFVLTFKNGQYRLTTFNKQGKLLKTYSIKSYKKLAKIIYSLVSINIA